MSSDGWTLRELTAAVAVNAVGEHAPMPYVVAYWSQPVGEGVHLIMVSTLGLN